MDRIFQDIKIKASNSEQRIITAIANSGVLDRTGEIVSIAGITYDPKNLPALLWQHKHDQPLGRILSLSKTAKGLEMTAQIAKYETDSELKQLSDSVWESVKQGVIKSCSIGFRPTDYEKDSTGAIVWTSSELLEVSLVSVPAERGANITGFKSNENRKTPSTKLPEKKHTVVKLARNGVQLPPTNNVVADGLSHQEKLLATQLAYADPVKRKSLLEPFINEFGEDKANKVRLMADSLRGDS
ncbi:HK97 family phage prohead protease [Acinetobacter sp. YH12147]|uniref:HK97 family phage prohead protease n=1 Tax=Acinetobacter sp. YH12147 TaxID=2601130 RepID=UPI0015D382AE|nr:HK97 family phage prohead protease [Acinetobacter sp. YH12147]